MIISNNGLKLIESFEGLRLKAYKVNGANEKYWTIGYGHYGPDVKEGMIITKQQAETYLKNDLSNAQKAVDKYDKIYHFNQNQYDALVSFAYNIGSIDQLTNKGTRTIKQISNNILLYNKAGGTVLSGLKRRREAEKKLFDTSVDTIKDEIIDNINDIIKDDIIDNIDMKVSDTKMPTIKNGSTGKAVRVWQSILGFTSVSIDGSFGPNTLAKTKTFQTNHGLVADGIVGPKTWKAGLESV